MPSFMTFKVTVKVAVPNSILDLYSVGAINTWHTKK